MCFFRDALIMDFVYAEWDHLACTFQSVMWEVHIQMCIATIYPTVTSESLSNLDKITGKKATIYESLSVAKTSS